MPESPHRSGSRTSSLSAVLLSGCVAVALVTTMLGVAAPASAGIKAARLRYAAAIEPLAAYQAQTTCSPRAKPGVLDFSQRLLRAYPRTRSLGIVRACSAGGRSEHKEGRAFDWAVNARSAADRAKVARVMRWLFKKDVYGNRHAMARRLGIQYVIWNRKIWGSYAASSGWRTYRGASPHTDHVHFSFTWAGARKKTSFWTGKVGNVLAAPKPRPVPTPSPTPTLPRPTLPRPTIPTGRPAPVAPVLLPSGVPLADETVRLVGTRGKATTVGALQVGQEYLVEVSGTYRWGSGADQLADAECSRTVSDASWRRDRSVHPAGPAEDHLDLYLDGVDLFADPDVDTGEDCDERTHTYRDTFVPTRTGRMTLEVWDPTTLSDNGDELAVRIIALSPAKAEMEWQLPASAGAGVTSPGAVEGGATYVVTVRGTVEAGNGITADAECSAGEDGTWQRARSVSAVEPTADHLDVLVNRRAVTFTPVTDPERDGCDTVGHAYRYVLKPSTTSAVNLRVNDPDWGDNAGALTVHVERVDYPIGSETVAVDTSLADVETERNYLAGQPVTITATGTYTYAPGVTADAECSQTVTDQTWRASRAEVLVDGRYLGDVQVDGDGDWTGASGARCEPTTHSYTMVYTPSRTGPLLLGVADQDRSDNSGIVMVTISALASP